MATFLEHLPAVTRLPGAGRPLAFQRGQRTATAKGSRKRRVLKVRHVLALTALAAGLFCGLDKAYLFVVSWDQLTVRTIELRCERPAVRRTLEGFLRTRPLGNILFCDLALLQAQLKSTPWVKDARVQKVFPSTLRIEIMERVPFVLIEKDGLALVDRDGTVLERPASPVDWSLPVVKDEGAFRDGFAAKWETARATLEALTAAEMRRLLSLESSDDGSVSLLFRDDPLRIILDGTDVRTRLDRFAEFRGELEGQFGSLAYADLRLDGRIIVRPQEPAAENPPATPKKEAT